jgi:anti-sigma28 factor (negative regulator of flagellin synthesis)
VLERQLEQTNRSRPAIDAPCDEVMAHWHAVVGDLPDVRQDKVESVRNAIQSGTYDEEGLLDKALPRIQTELDVLVQEAQRLVADCDWT